MYDLITTLLAYLLIIVVFVAVAGFLVMLFKLIKNREFLRSTAGSHKNRDFDDQYFDVFTGRYYNHLPSNMHYNDD